MEQNKTELYFVDDSYIERDGEYYDDYCEYNNINRVLFFYAEQKTVNLLSILEKDFIKSPYQDFKEATKMFKVIRGECDIKLIRIGNYEQIKAWHDYKITQLFYRSDKKVLSLLEVLKISELSETLKTPLLYCKQKQQFDDGEFRWYSVNGYNKIKDLNKYEIVLNTGTVWTSPTGFNLLLGYKKWKNENDFVSFVKTKTKKELLDIMHEELIKKENSYPYNIKGIIYNGKLKIMLDRSKIKPTGRPMFIASGSSYGTIGGIIEK